MPDAAGLAALLLACVLDWRWGEPAVLWSRAPHPVVVIGRAIARLERLMLDPVAAGWRNRLAGIGLVLLLVGGAAAAGTAVAALLRDLAGGWLVEGVLISSLIAWRSLHDHVAAVSVGLGQGLAQGRAAVRHIVGRDPDTLDEAAVARAAVESLAENFSDGVVAPVFWAAVGGLPGILAYKALNTLDSMVGHRSPRYRDFGWASARLDDLANLLPSRLSALLIALSAVLIPRCGGKDALVACWRYAPRHRSPNAGWPEAAVAGALRLRLAGPRRYRGELVTDAWMGDGRATLDAADIWRSLLLVGTAHRLLLAALAAALILVLF